MSTKHFQVSSLWCLCKLKTGSSSLKKWLNVQVILKTVYHCKWPVSNKYSKYSESGYHSNVYLLLVKVVLCCLLTWDIKINTERQGQVISVYIFGRCCKLIWKYCFCLHFLHACQECITASKVPSDHQRSWFETCNTDVLPWWTDDLAFQKPKLENSRPLPLAVHYQTQSSFPTQTHQKHALSVQHKNTLGITFTDRTHHCAEFICNKTKTPKTSCKLIFTTARLGFYFRCGINFYFLNYLKSETWQNYLSSN